MKSFNSLNDWLDCGKPYNSLICCDCMDAMPYLNDKQFDISLVDPPYGIDVSKTGFIGGDNLGVAKDYKAKKWDEKPPDKKYFDELFRVSKNQIVWGVNYFTSITELHGGRFVWNKDNSGNFSDCELAFQSFTKSVRMFTWRWNGMLQQNMKEKEKRIHPTQKPRALYRWILSNYAEGCETILDTHAGSCSSCIEFEIGGYQWIAFERDVDYFNDAKARMKRELAQGRLDFGA